MTRADNNGELQSTGTLVKKVLIYINNLGILYSFGMKPILIKLKRMAFFDAIMPIILKILFFYLKF